jgi:hypothetical protein
MRRCVLGQFGGGPFECRQRLGQPRFLQRLERQPPIDPVAKRIRGRGPGIRDRRVRAGGLSVADLSHEPVAAPRERLDVSRRLCRVADGPANVGDRAGQRVLGDMDVRPELVEQIFLGDGVARP